MDEALTPQELFDTQVAFMAIQLSILNQFNLLWHKHGTDLADGIKSAEYHRDLGTIAETHGLKYEPPTKIGMLSKVDTISPTLH